MKSFPLILIAVLTAPFLQNCGTPDTPTYECTPDITVLLPEKALSMFFFKEGSYWIYQREDSAYTDSVWVTAAHEYILPVSKKIYPDFKGEKCYQSRSTFFSSENGYFFTSSDFGLQNRVPKNTLSYSEELFVLYEAPVLSSGRSDQIRLDFIGNEHSSINAYGDSVYHLDSIKVDGKLYFDITMYKQKVQKPDYLKEAYYAPGYGMIRFKDIHDAWWSLIRCNIIQ